MTRSRPRRVRRTRAEWQQLIEEQAASGQSQTAFCAAHSLSVTNFQNWKSRLKKEATDASWIEVEAVPTPLSSDWEIELALGGGMTLRLRRC